MRKLIIAALVVLVTLVALIGCAGGGGKPRGPVDAFVFTAGANPLLGETVTGALNTQPDPLEITVVVPPGTSLRRLVATFSLNVEATISTISSGAKVVQQNGVTPNDFSASVMYTVEVPKVKKPWRYKVTVREADTNARLAQIALADGAVLKPSFSPAVKSYTATVLFAAKQVRIDARAESQFLKSITIDGQAVRGAGGSGSADFSSGQEKTVIVETVAEDGVSREEYSILVVRGAPDRNNNLDGLEIAGSPLVPGFSALRKAYQAQVPFDARQFVVKAKPQSQFSTVALSGIIMTGKTQSRGALASKGDPVDKGGATVDFAVGDRVGVVVAVTAQDGSVQEYVVDVARAEPERVNTLASLAVIGGRISPAFTPAGLSYVAEVPFLASSVAISAQVAGKFAKLSFEPGPAAPAGTTEIASKGDPASRTGAAFDFSVGDRLSLVLAVTAQDGKVLRYFLDIRRGEPERINTLASLAVIGGRLSPAFQPAYLAYAVEVPFASKSVAFTAQPAGKYATLAFEPGPAAPQGAAEVPSKGDPLSKTGIVFDFSVGDRLSLAAAVTAQDGRVLRYVLDVRRAPPDSNADLASLAVSGGILSPLFTPRMVSYTVSLPASIETVKLIMTTASMAAAVAADQPLAQAGPQWVVTVAAPAGKVLPVNVTVTAEDGSQRLYRISVSREALPPGGTTTKDGTTRLAALQVTGAALAPAFDPALLAYDVKLAANVESVVVSARAESPLASLTLEGSPLAAAGRTVPVAAGSAVNVAIDVTAESGAVARTTLRLSREGTPAVKPPAGNDSVRVTARNLLLDKREAAVLAGRGEQVGSQATVSVRYSRTNEVVLQETVPVGVRASGGSWVITLDYRSPGVALAQGRLVEVEVLIPTTGKSALLYAEAQASDSVVQVDVPFFLLTDKARASWPAVGSAVKVAGYISMLAPGKSGRASDGEQFEMSEKGEFGVALEIKDPKTGKVLGTDAMRLKPGAPRGSTYYFKSPMTLPEGATVAFTLTSTARSGKVWQATGTTVVRTIALDYNAGFAPVLLVIDDELAERK